MHLFLGTLLVVLKFSSVQKNSVYALPSAAAAADSTTDVPTFYATTNKHLSDGRKSTMDKLFQITPGEVLREAARNGNISHVIEMLSGGLHVDDTDDKGWTGLMWASRCGHESIVDYLLEKGANEDHQSSTGDSSLLWAAYGGFISIVTTFLAMEVDPDTPEEKGMTPLMAAAFAGNTDVVEILLDAGADKNIKDKSGLNALMYATRIGRNDITILLNDYTAVNAIDYQGWTALHYAVSLNTSSAAESMAELLKSCPDLEISATIGEYNWTAIEFAIGINNDYAFSKFQEHFAKLSETCILDLSYYMFPEVVYFDCRQFQCHCYGHWVPIGTDPDCRKITLEVLASQDLKKNVRISSLPDI